VHHQWVPLTEIGPGCAPLISAVNLWRARAHPDRPPALGAALLFPAYGAHKAGLDKFAADMAVDCKDYNLAVMSIWMGALLTERLRMVIASDPVNYSHLEEMAETPEFTGHVIYVVHVFAAPLASI
jgi:NAD(P)-dependent dehydrogenase (short-subunit alcohol dehydrogenase family)